MSLNKILTTFVSIFFFIFYCYLFIPTDEALKMENPTKINKI